MAVIELKKRLKYAGDVFKKLLEIGFDEETAGQFLNDIKDADAAEVKHGKWKIKRDDYDCEYMMCSCCKEEFYPVDADTVDTTFNYCPTCGAKMDGVVKRG